jgi:hypothetical protein
MQPEAAQLMQSELMSPSGCGSSASDASGAMDAALVSFQAELPLPLQEAMTRFIESYPNWDQYRLVQAALAGFLVQNGVESRAITRLYVGNMFRRQSLLQQI